MPHSRALKMETTCHVRTGVAKQFGKMGPKVKKEHHREGLERMPESQEPKAYWMGKGK